MLLLKATKENPGCLENLNDTDTPRNGDVDLLLWIEHFSILTLSGTWLCLEALGHFSVRATMEIKKEQSECFEIWSECNFLYGYLDVLFKAGHSLFWPSDAPYCDRLFETFSYVFVNLTLAKL